MNIYIFCYSNRQSLLIIFNEILPIIFDKIMNNMYLY